MNINTDSKEYKDAKIFFLNNATKLEEFNKILTQKDSYHQKIWCEPGIGGCCCIGCINNNVRELGYNKYHWEVWINELRKPQENDDYERFNFNLHINNVEKEDKIKLVNYLKKIFTSNTLNKNETVPKTAEILNLVNDSIKGCSLYTSDYYSVSYLAKEIEKLGVNTDIKKGEEKKSKNTIIKIK